MHYHVLLCLEGLSKQDLDNVMNYMYNGEVSIYQEDLDRFLSVAQRLKLEGLLESNQEEEDTDTEHPIRPQQRQETIDPLPVISNEEDQKIHKQRMKSRIEGSKQIISLNTTLSSEIDATLNENLEALEGGHYRCRLCGKDSLGMKSRNRRQNMKNHVETHVEGLSFNCQHCGKVFRCENSLFKHKSLKHKISSQD